MERTLTQLPFWSSLTEQEQETLRRSAFVRHYEKGAFVHISDNECLGTVSYTHLDVYKRQESGQRARSRLITFHYKQNPTGSQQQSLWEKLQKMCIRDSLTDGRTPIIHPQCRIT